MSDKSSTFALEIGKGLVFKTSAGKRNRQRRGTTCEEYPAEKHIPQVCGEKRRSLSDFGLLLFSFCI